MPHILKLAAVPVAMLLLGGVVGYLLGPRPATPVIQIKAVEVRSQPEGDQTRLYITTHYTNTGCTKVLLARFLINSHPAPSISLPKQEGPTILPVDGTEIAEEVVLGFSLTEGTWHMYSVASCFQNGEPVPAATVAPTALFDVDA
jgi:hypothetical protein